LSNQAVNIDVGGKQLIVTPSSLLSPSEAMAVSQVLHSGQQSLLLNTLGSADGGSLTIGSQLSAHLNSLIIPKGVTVTDYSNSGSLHLGGALRDYGTFFLSTNNAAVSNFSIVAKDITIGSGGFLTVGTSGVGTVAAGTATVGTAAIGAGVGAEPIQLSILSQNNLVNAGTISSPGSLTLVANHAISNISSSSTNALATINAAGNLNLVSNSLNNTGIIASSNGSININAPNLASNISINAVGGTFQAVNGAINIRSASYSGAANTVLAGGNYLSQSLNIYSGQGNITGFIGEVSGALNSSGSTEHLYADTPLLNIGSNYINGDPTFANTGNIVISGANVFNAAVSIIAGGDISSDGTGSITTTGSNEPVTLIAGATINLNGDSANPTGSPAGTLSGSPASGVTPNSVNVSFGSNGGNIDFSANSGSNASIQTSGSNVILLANANGSGTGNIWFPTTGTSINTSISSGAGGAVLIIAGGTGGTVSSNAVQLGAVTTGGSPGGAVQIYTAAPAVSGGASASFATDGTTSATFAPSGGGSSPLITPGASITTGIITTAGAGGNGAGGTIIGGNGNNGGALTIIAGAAINSSSIETFGGGGGGGEGTTSVGGSGGSGGAINILSYGGAINISGDLNSSGGGGGGGGSGGAGGVGGNAGNITVSTSSALQITGVVLAASGGDGGAHAGGTGGGGGSFGGGGGGSGGAASGFAGANGGGGIYGGGGGGGGTGFGAGYAGGGGGGGGFAGSGAGGGGGGNSQTLNGGGGGGGGAGSTAGGNAGTAGSGNGTGGGGTAGSATAGTGGSAGGGSGNGGSGGSGSSIAGTGGAGGEDTDGGEGGNGGTSTGISRVDFSGFGQGNEQAGASASATAGQVKLYGQTANITGQITFAPFAGQAVNAQGVGGSVSIISTAGASLNPHYNGTDFGSSTAEASASISAGGTNSFTSAGTIQSTSININGISYTNSAPAQSYAGAAALVINEGAAPIVVPNLTQVTDSEYVALVQVSTLGLQSLILSQATPTSSPGTGFASGGSLTISTSNIAGDFEGVVVPSGVTVNVDNTVTQFGSLESNTINGILNFAGANVQVSLFASTVVNGAINFAGNGATINYLAAISGTGLITASSGTLNLSTNVGGATIYGSSSSSPFLVSSGALSGLSLLVTSSSSVNLSDPNNETVVLGNNSSSGGAFSLAANGNLQVGSFSNLGSSFNLRSANGNILLSSGIVASGAVTINAANGSITAQAISSGGAINIGNTTGATGVTLNGTVTNTSASGAAINILTNTGGINGNSSSVTSSGDLNLTDQTSGGITFSSGSVFSSSGGNISIQALSSGNVQVDAVNNTSNSGTIVINANQGVTTVGIGGAAVSAQDGSLSIGNTGAGAGVNIGGPISTAYGAIDIYSSTGSIVGNNQAIAINNIDSAAITINPGNGNITSLGSVTNSTYIYIGTSDGASSSASGIAITGTVSNTLGGASDNNVYILTNSGGISTVGINSTGTVLIKALSTTSSGAVSTGSIDTTAGGSSGADVIVDSASGSIITGLINSGASISIGNSTAATGVSLTGNLTASSGAINILSSAGTITGNNYSIKATNGDVTINPGSGNDASIGAITTNGNVYIGTNSASGIAITGTIDNTSGSGDVQVLTNTGGISTGAISTSGSVNIMAVAAFSSGLVTTGAINNATGSQNVTIDSASGSISVGSLTSNGIVNIGGRTGTAGITISGAITNSGGSGNLNILSSTGGIVGGANNISAGGNLVISSVSSGNISFSSGSTLSSSLGNVTVQCVGAGNVVIDGASTPSGNKSITVDAANGLVTVGVGGGALSAASNGSIIIGDATGSTGVTLGGSLSTANSGPGIISIQSSQGTINGNSQTISAGIGNVIVNPGTGNITSLGSITSSGIIDIGTADGSSSSAGNIVILGTLDNSAGSQNVNIISPSGSVTIANINSSNTVNISAPTLNIPATATVTSRTINLNGPGAANFNLNNAGTLNTAKGVTITSAAGYDLNIFGGGIVSAATGNDSSNSIMLTPGSSAANSVTFSGSQTFDGPTAIYASGIKQSINVASGADVSCNAQFNLNSNFLTLQGTISGNPLVFNPQGQGTIASSSVNALDLKSLGTLTFNGSSLAIISSSGIINSGAALTINLANTSSSGNVNGGSLVMLAGFTFSGGSTLSTSSSTFNNFASNLSGGSINIPNVTITTSAANGSAGNVFVAANGSVTLGKITSNSTSASGSGGSVSILGKGITVGAISTIGGASGGAVSLTSVTPTISGAPSITGGILYNGGFIAKDGTLNGNISFASINAGSANVMLSTGGSGGLNQTAGSSVSSGILVANTGASNIVLNVSSSGLQLNTLGASNAAIADNVGTNLGNSTIGGSFTLADAGSVQISGSEISAGSNISIKAGVIATSAGALTINNSSLNSTLGSVFLSDAASGGVISIDKGSVVSALTSLNISALNNISVGTTPGTNPVQTGTQLSAGTTLTIAATGTNAKVDLDLNSSLSAGSSASISSSKGTVEILSSSCTAGSALTISGTNGVAIGNSSTQLASGGATSLTSSSLTGTGINIAQGSTVDAGSSLNLNSASGIILGSNVTLDSNTTMSFVSISSGSGLSIGQNAVLQAGLLNLGPNPALPASPAPLSSGNIESAGSLTITVSGSGGIVANQNDSITANGGNVTMTASAGSISLAKHIQLQVNGGSLTLTSSGGSLQIGTSPESAAQEPSLVATRLNNSGGNISITALNGIGIMERSKIFAGGNLSLLSIAKSGAAGGSILIGLGSSIEAHGSVNVTDQGTAAVVNIGSALGGATIKSGANDTVSNGTGLLAIVSANSIVSSQSSVLSSNGASLSITSTSATGSINLQDSTNVGASGGNVTITGAGQINIGTAGDSGTLVSATAGSNTTGVVTVSSASGGLNIASSSTLESAGAMTLSGNGKNGTVQIADGASLSSGQNSIGAMTISSSGAVDIGSINGTGAQLQTGAISSALTVNGAGILLGDNSSLAAVGALSLTNNSKTASIQIGNTATLKAGTVTAPSANGNLAKNQIQSSGSLTINSAGTVTIGSDCNLTSSGSDLRITAGSGSMSVGSSNNFVANGGNVFLFAKGSITGATSNFFHARSVGTAASSSGGGIEIGAGLTTSSNLINALNKKTTQPTTPLGTGTVTITNNNGVIEANSTSSGLINLTFSASSPAAVATLNLNNPSGAPLQNNSGGAQVFDAQGTQALKFDGGTFQTEALKPISMLVPDLDSEIQQRQTVIVEQAENGASIVSVGNSNTELELVDKNGANRLVIKAESGSLIAKSTQKPNAQILVRAGSRISQAADGSICLEKGELLLNATNAVAIKTDLVELYARRGALAAVAQSQGRTCIKSCGAAGTIVVKIDGRLIALNAGEELLITDHQLDRSEIHPGDGLGRRNSVTRAYGDHYTSISDFAIITFMANSDLVTRLATSSTSTNKQIIARMLKAAAAVESVTKYRGAYSTN